MKNGNGAKYTIKKTAVMKLLFTLLFSCIIYLANAQHNSNSDSGRLSSKPVNPSSRQNQRLPSKRFISFISNNTQKIYEESFPDDGYVFEAVPIIEMNRLAGYAWFPERDMNQKMQPVKALRQSHDRQVRIQQIVNGFASAIFTLMHVER